MRSLWNDVTALIDADTLSVWVHEGRRAPCADAPHEVVAHEGRPADALARVLAGLPKARLPMCNRMHVIVGHPWSHGVVLPWQEGLVSDAAWEAYARMLFAARAQRGALRILIEDERRGRTRLAVAACDALLTALVDASRAAGWRIASFRDALSASLDAHAARLGGDDFSFALRQPHVVTCIFRRSGEWRDVVTLPHAGERADDWFAAAALIAGQPAGGDTYASRFDGSMFSGGNAAGASPDRTGVEPTGAAAEEPA
ncbi:hypothetical protein LGN17_24480 [Burkholderia sp. AU30280]|uniref:hypothetical protein n=1 Tax=Burkholderia sp. AU30280 TaxID=2879628 RepID=UPI001CF201E5|nr:hypothetical protein [Burkholderia sp. AU30280]MCA8275641.1 hypothetical protein [Burkholderia sp. AU30280]